MSTPDYILRRADFILTEARLPDGRYDQATKYAMRVISNWAAVGADVGSRTVKERNLRMSVAARELRAKMPMQTWCAETINEHPEPMKMVWDWARAQAAELSADSLVQRIAAHPMVTVTKEEDARLRKLKFTSSGDPLERYRKAGIEICRVDPVQRQVAAYDWPSTSGAARSRTRL